MFCAVFTMFLLGNVLIKKRVELLSKVVIVVLDPGYDGT